MSISFVGKADAAASSVALPAFTAGDLAIVFAFNNASTTIPSLPAGWTALPGTSTRTGTTCAARVGFRELVGGDTVTGTWTNATHVEVIVLRGADTAIGCGALTPNSGASATPTWAAATLTDPNGGSWIVLLGGHRTATDMNSVALGASTNETPGQTSLAMHDVRGTSSNWASTNKTVNQNSGWITFVIEALQATGHDRISQLPIEVVEKPTSVKARIEQLPIEVVELSGDAKARVEQLPIEVVYNRVTTAVISQFPIEVVYRNLPGGERFYALIID